MRRIGLLHTGAVVIPAFATLTAEQWPGTEVLNLLDDRIVADLRSEERRDSVRERSRALVHAAAASGAEAVVLTCSSISGYAAPVAEEVGIPVLRIDEAMADEAAAIGGRIAVLATLPTTLEPTCVLLEERLRLAGREATIERVLVDGAFVAVVAGDRAEHDRLVGEAVRAACERADVIVLAQASMASAAAGDHPVPVLSSPALGVARAKQLLGLS